MYDHPGPRSQVHKVDSVSPLSFFGKKKKVKSQTVTPTLPKSQGPKASKALSKKKQKPKSKKTLNSGEMFSPLVRDCIQWLLIMESDNEEDFVAGEEMDEYTSPTDKEVQPLPPNKVLGNIDIFNLVLLFQFNAAGVDYQYKDAKTWCEAIQARFGGNTKNSSKPDVLIRDTWLMMKFQPTWILWLSQTQSRTQLGFTSYNAVAPPPTGLFVPPSIDLSISGLEEFQHPKFKGYGPKDSNSV
uniref:Uncharacterized protein n=1 Tax=Tanacetum cinerariifolium TaxID=118510 RepID=A0A6L2JQC7_TANCI|nr:hypothetical protein [Tanacetum cinerariifolium]